MVRSRVYTLRVSASASRQISEELPEAVATAVIARSDVYRRR